MAEGAKRAHSDLNIEIDAPTEDLTVVAERPMDYTNAIELSKTRNQSLGPVFEKLGAIATDINDTNRTINAYDHDVDYKDRYQEMMLQQDYLDELEHMRLSNQVQETRLQMHTEIAKAREQALNSKGAISVQDAVAGVFEEYKDQFSDSFEGSKMWSAYYNDDFMTASLKDLQTDFTVEKTKMFHNADISKNQIYKNILTGDIDVDAGFTQYAKDTAEMREHITFEEYTKNMDETYRTFVLGKAAQFAKYATGTNALSMSNAVKDLINQYYKKEYTCYGKDGKPLLDENGKEVKYTATLDAQTMNALLGTAHTLANAHSGAGSAGTAKTLAEFKNATGAEDIEKLGVSDYMMTSSPEKAEADYQRTINSIMSDPTDTDSQKASKYREITQYYNSVLKPAVYAYEVFKLNPNAKDNYATIAAQLNKLDAALNADQNMVDFSLDFNRADGSVYTLKPPIDYASMSMSDSHSAARNIWKNISTIMHKAVNATSSADFLMYTNTKYKEAANWCMDMGVVTSLISYDKGVITPNNRNLALLTAGYEQLRNTVIDTTGGVGTYTSLPKPVIDAFVSQYNSISGPGTSEKKAEFARMHATALINSGNADLILTNSTQAGGKSEEAMAALQQHLYLANCNSSALNHLMSDSAKIGGGKHTLEAAKEYLDAQNLKGVNLIPTVNEALTKYNVPLEYHESLRSTIASVAMAYGAVGTTDKTAAQTALKNHIDHIVSSNFVSLKSPFVKKAVFVGNPALVQGGNPADYANNIERVSNMITKTGNQTSQALQKMGIIQPYSDFNFKLDSSTGQMVVHIGGQPLRMQNQKTGIYSMPVAIPYNFEKMKPANLDKAEWDNAISDYVTTSATLSYMGKITEVQRLAPNVIDPVTKKKVPAETIVKDSLKALSVLQQDDFLQKYAQAVESGNIGINPAPGYMKNAFLQPSYYTTTQKVTPAPWVGYVEHSQATTYHVPEHLSKMLDFAYSKSVGYNKVDTTINKPLSYEIRGYNYSGVLESAKTNGFRISRDYDPLNVKGVTKSSHNKGMALDFGVYDNKMEDGVTGRIKLSSLESFTTMVTKNPAYAGKVRYILTSRPELLDNKPEYKEYAKYRNMKGADGGPLFKDARAIDKNLLKRNNHSNHFHVEFKEAVVDKNRQDIPLAYNALADDMSSTSNPSQAPISKADAFALLSVFGPNYNNTSAFGGFGMANLTPAEYESLGVPSNSIKDPIIQSRVMGNRFQAYQSALGNQELAVLALGGSKFKSIPDGKIMTIQEILSSGKIAGVGDQRFIVAPSDAATQAQQASMLKKFKKAQKAQRS